MDSGLCGWCFVCFFFAFRSRQTKRLFKMCNICVCVSCVWMTRFGEYSCKDRHAWADGRCIVSYIYSSTRQHLGTFGGNSLRHPFSRNIKKTFFQYWTQRGTHTASLTTKNLSLAQCWELLTSLELHPSRLWGIKLLGICVGFIFAAQQWAPRVKERPVTSQKQVFLTTHCSHL